jgi:hypothetical protein
MYEMIEAKRDVVNAATDGGGTAAEASMVEALLSGFLGIRD